MPKTLRKHYRGELDHGHVKANAKVAENLYRKATGDGREAVIAAIFWLKTRAGWKETHVTEVAARRTDKPQLNSSSRRLYWRGSGQYLPADVPEPIEVTAPDKVLPMIEHRKVA